MLFCYSGSGKEKKNTSLSNLFVHLNAKTKIYTWIQTDIYTPDCAIYAQKINKSKFSLQKEAGIT